jgi:hypothetical protein
VVTKLKRFEGDFLAGLNRTQDLFVGLSEGLSANPALRVDDMTKLLTKIYARFGQFLTTDEVNAVKLKKIENETDEAFFRAAKSREKVLHEATYKVQEGAAAGKAICELTSQNSIEAEREQGRSHRQDAV